MAAVLAVVVKVQVVHLVLKLFIVKGTENSKPISKWALFRDSVFSRMCSILCCKGPRVMQSDPHEHELSFVHTMSKPKAI